MLILSKSLNLEELFRFYQSNQKLVLDENSVRLIQKSYDYLQKKIQESAEPIYGINTGFGALCNTKIPNEDLSLLQYNLIRSHAAGIGARVPKPIVRWMILLKILHLCKGHSGVSLSAVQRLIDFYNHEIYPIVYEQGSLGASGDLAPLAHLCLPLIGEGEVLYQEKQYSGKEILAKFQWKPIELGPKEGLALLNGTQFMNAYGLHLLMEFHRIWENWKKTAALSCEAFECVITPFKALLHEIRFHPGQKEVSEWFYKTLSNSPNIIKPKNQVQDPYSFRCIPQVLGASLDVVRFVQNTFSIETNSVSDNPNVFVEQDCVLSGGNFHGQPLALALDFLAIAFAEIASISERRSYWLLSGTRGLNPFLAFHPGLESGLMIAQYTAASIINQNKQLCYPNSVDTIPSSNGQEDHVSMGANAATKCLKVFENVKKVVAIEFLHAYRAIQLKNLKNEINPALQEMVNQFEKHYTLPTTDFYMSEAIQKVMDFLDK